jgi:cytochrome c oxidase subunit 3
MNTDKFPEDNSVQIEKAKKNLIYVGILSIVMLFAGFTSAYIVSMGDSFWLKFPLPSSFWISTALIALSSLTYVLSVRSAKKGSSGGMKLYVFMTVLLGVGFVIFQFRGYGQLIENGVHAVNNHIIVTDGKYGDYFEVKMDGKYVEVDGNDFLLAGKKMSAQELKEYQAFMSQFLKADNKAPFKPANYGDRFILNFKDQPLITLNGELMKSDSTRMEYLDNLRLSYLAMNVRDGRGDFFVRGDIGKDFKIYYKGKELGYEDRELRLDGVRLSNYLQIKAMESADTASSYLYIITFLHLLHIFVALLYLLRVVFGTLRGSINPSNSLSLRLGGIFWHFLGILWLYLLLFLLFIH